MRARRRTAELVEARLLSPSVRSLVFRLPDGEPFPYRAGQHVDLYVPTARGLVYRRAYSIASPPDPEALPAGFEIAVTRVDGGPASSALHQLAPGAFVAVEGPRGAFVRRDGPRDPLLFVATGSGLAPLRAMIGDLVAHEAPGRAATLLYGCRTEADLLWADELAAWARERHDLHVEVTLSRPSPSWHGRRGHVQEHLAAVAAPLAHAHAYVAGLSAMVRDVAERLAHVPGWSRAQVHDESYD